MKRLTGLFLALMALTASAKTNKTSPLLQYSSEWGDAKYQVCNTAANAQYLTTAEKELICILNLARVNPQLFCKTVVSQAHKISSFIDTSSEVYYKTLVNDLMQQAPLPLLRPDSLCFVSAHCHAASSGPKGYVGHTRQSADCRKKQHFAGECCQYGITDPLEIVLSLLVDQDVESLGHRQICLGRYTKMSPSMAAHKTYGSIAVLDFEY